MIRSKRANRLAAVGLSFGLSFAALNGTTNEAPKQFDRVEHVDPAREAREAAIAMSLRYGSCAITDVVDYHESKSQPSHSADDQPRDRITVTVHLTKSPQAEQVAKKYAHDGTVHWRTADVKFRERNLNNPNESRLGMRTALPATEQFANYAWQQPLDMKATVFPAQSDRGRMVDVVVMSDGESKVGDQKVEAYGGISCGALATKIVAGQPTWAVDTEAKRSGDFLQVKTCEPGVDPAQPGVLTEICTRVDR